MSKVKVLIIISVILSLGLLFIGCSYLELRENEFDRQMRYRCEEVLNQYLYTKAYYSKDSDVCETPSVELVGEKQIEEAIKTARFIRNVKQL